MGLAAATATPTAPEAALLTATTALSEGAEAGLAAATVPAPAALELEVAEPEPLLEPASVFAVLVETGAALEEASPVLELAAPPLAEPVVLAAEPAPTLPGSAALVPGAFPVAGVVSRVVDVPGFDATLPALLEPSFGSFPTLPSVPGRP